MNKPVQTEPWIRFCCIQGSVCTDLYMILLYSGFSLYWFIHDSVVFRVQFVLVYSWFCCIQGSVCTGLFMILLYSGFSLYWFIHDFVVFRIQFVLVYTWFCCIQDSVCTGLCMILLYSGLILNTTESCINQYKLNPEYNRIMYKPVQTEPWIQQNHV
jgi:hypothetical protein